MTDPSVPPGPPPATPQSGGYSGQLPADQPQKKRRTAIIALVAVVVLALIGGLLAFFTLGDDSAEAAEGEIFLLAADDVGPDPFAADPFAPAPDPAPTPTQPEATTVTAGPNVQLAAASGSKPGLYGGTMNQATCDADAMVAFLAQNPDKAKAWVEAFNKDPLVALPDGSKLTVSNISTYVASLTSVVLTADTRVTNHGFKNGKLTTLQSVLQKGTAVLVDSYGTPRVKCYCGNPLLAPVASKTKPVYSGKPWADFNPASVTIVQQSSTVVNNFVLVDVKTGQLFNRPAGSTGAKDAASAAAGTTTAPTTAPAAPTTAAPSTAAPTTAAPATAAPTTAAPAAQLVCSVNNGPQKNFDFTNTSSQDLEIVWLDESCNEVSSGTLPANSTTIYNSTTGHSFLLKDPAGNVVSSFVYDGSPAISKP